MALNQLPTVEATIQVVHSGPTTGGSFTTLLSASDGAPIAAQQVFTFNLSVFAPGLVATPPSAPFVAVYKVSNGERVDVGVTIASALITLTFWDPVTPADYRVKVMG